MYLATLGTQSMDNTLVISILPHLVPVSI
uniref:Uncharacterized protein n=1 Tax=Rhizophora mucronata TaxID=61149 RepID=A0A2P2Q0I7_RHIMU